MVRRETAEIKSVTQSQLVGWKRVYEEIRKRDDMLLQPQERDLERSLDEGLAFALESNGEVIAYMRFTPLLNEEWITRLGLPKGFPQIWEMGTLIVDEEFRDQHLYPRLQEGLLEKFQDQIEQRKLLIIATTKNWKAIPRAAERVLGRPFAISRHLSTPFVAAFTCVCEGDFGCGLQNDTYCQFRVNNDQLPLLSILASEHQNKIPCILLSSDRNLLFDIDTSLRVHFSEQRVPMPEEYLVHLLKDGGYYE